MGDVILVTGATGRVGREVVAGLARSGRPVRALSRNPAEAGLPAGVEVVPGDVRDPATVRERARGADAAFLLWPFMDAAGVDDVADALARQVGRVVVLSAEAAARRPRSFWAATERAVAGRAREWTFLRPTGFAANTLMWADQIRTTGVVRGVYAIGREVEWHEVSRAHVQEQLAGVSDTALDTWESFVATPEVVTSAVAEITGRPAHTFGDWAHNHADSFR